MRREVCEDCGKEFSVYDELTINCTACDTYFCSKCGIKHLNFCRELKMDVNEYEEGEMYIIEIDVCKNEEIDI